MYDASKIDPEEYQELKNYLDSENISYIEDVDAKTIEFDDTDIDDEWAQRLPEKFEDDEDILSVKDDEGTESDDLAALDDKIDEDKVFYVKIEDEGGVFYGKIYKLFDEGDWRAKLVKGESDTFEKLNYDPDWDEFDIVAFLRENYADAEIIDETEFNKVVESSLAPNLGRNKRRINEAYQFRIKDGDKLIATEPTEIYVERTSGANVSFENDRNTGKIPPYRVITPSWKGCTYIIEPGEVFTFRTSKLS